MSDEVKPKPFITLLYLGVREGQDTPRVHEWAEVDDLPNDGSPLPATVKTRIYGAKKKRHNNIATTASPGAIYKFEQDDPSSNERRSIYPSSANFQGRWQNKDDVARWQAESRAIDYAIDLKAKEKKDNKRRHDMECLEPICEAYHKLVGPQKTILLAEVIKFITTWRPSKAITESDEN